MVVGHMHRELRVALVTGRVVKEAGVWAMCTMCDVCVWARMQMCVCVWVCVGEGGGVWRMKRARNCSDNHFVYMYAHVLSGIRNQLSTCARVRGMCTQWFRTSAGGVKDHNFLASSVD